MHVMNYLATIGLAVCLLTTFAAGFRAGRWSKR